MKSIIYSILIGGYDIEAKEFHRDIVSDSDQEIFFETTGQVRDAVARMLQYAPGSAEYDIRFANDTVLVLSILKRVDGGYWKPVDKNVYTPCGKTHTGASAGIDFGLKTFMTFSDGTEIEAPQFYKRLLRKVRKWQRLLSKSAKGSAHYRAYRRQLNRVYAELADKRQDWFYQTAHAICRKYEYLFVEDLNIAGMARMKHWGRKVNDLGWTGFLRTLKYIATKYGVTVHEIDRWFASSRMCDCGYKNDALTLDDREWTCPRCGTHHQRDLHAAKNILRRGIAELESIGKTCPSIATAG